jgi:GntR family transcriptional regulator / MocR family aminotransferase
VQKRWAISGVDLHVVPRGSRRRAGLEAALRDAVRAGRLATGVRLPPSRSLAADLGVARNTVASAYAQLVAEGWLEARQGSGTWVAARAPAAKRTDENHKDQSRSALYDLRPGSPDLTSFPRNDWLRAAQRALRGASPDSLGYPDPRGRLELRRALADYLARARGVDVAPERVLVCSGFAQGLAIVAAALKTEGCDDVAVEAYGHTSHRTTLAACGLATSTVDVDEQGARIDALDGGAVLLTPAHQFPLGPTLGARRRLQAVEWARANGAFIIEDDYDGEFRYDRQPIGALQALAPEQVVYAGTASKTLAPGLRLAWLVMPASLLEPAIAAKRLTDGPSTVDQLTMAHLIVAGAYDRHIRRLRLVYRRRRDRLVTLLARRAPAARVGAEGAGLHVLVHLPDGATEAATVAEAKARALALDGLASYRVGAQCHPPALVVGYGTPPEHAYSSAISRLCAVLAG